MQQDFELSAPLDVEEDPDTPYPYETDKAPGTIPPDETDKNAETLSTPGESGYALSLLHRHLPTENQVTMRTDYQGLIRVLLVDDEDDFLEDIRDALIYQQQIPYEIEIVGLARNGEQAIQLAQELEPDLIIMDLYMPPGLDGVQVAHILKYQPIRSKVLILSAYLDLKDMDSIVKADIRGYLLKGDLVQLVEGVQKVHLGQPCFPSQVIESLFRQQFWRLKEVSPDNVAIPWEDFSDRECQVIKMRQAGLPQTEIAQRMGVSASSIKTYVRRIEKKCPHLKSILYQD